MPKQVCPGQPASLNLPEKYAGQWVAISGDKVVGAAPTIDKAFAAASEKGEKHPKMVHIPDRAEHLFF